MPKRIPYDHLPLMPWAIADAVCDMQYTGFEISTQLRCGRTVELVEAARQKMTTAQRDEFCELTDKRCRAAYEAKADYFIKCIRAKGNRGRDQMYVWVSHWLSAYLLHPESFKRDCNVSKAA